MTEFLNTVAIHYKQEAENLAVETGEPASMPLSRYVFCFPNRRSALFFSRYLQESFGTACIVPETITINDLFSLFSTRCIADRTTLLFRLFNIYRQLSSRTDKEEFDQFVFWGDMLLSDFDDVDKYLAPAEKVFNNVRDLKEIEAAFAGFEPEVIEVIQSFWRNFKPASDNEDNKREVFSQTWSILKDLYLLFKKDLAKDNLAYSGMAEREVVEQEDLYLEKFPYQKVVFVGLTAISLADRKLMMRLKQQGLAEFCWDYADSLLRDRQSPMTSATYFSYQNLNDFPNALSEEEITAGLVSDKNRKYSLYAVPSAVGQTQLARRILQQWKETLPKFDPFCTAVILPDERLLLPMLYAVPQELGSFNVTMGYGLKNTPVSAFVQNLANLQNALRHREGLADAFYYRQVLPLLQHNYTTAIATEAAKTLGQKITGQNLYLVSVDEFAIDPFLQKIFRPVTTAEETISYILEVLEDIMQHDDLFSETDYEFLYHYRATVEKLGDIVSSQSFDFTSRTLFLLLGKLINSVSVPFSGEPLHGLQIMGVLETRALDFDNVIILSMNEGVFPAKSSSNSFIPNSLRNAFNMPTQKYRDAVFAYHFYRLISRAKHVTMIYDSRTDGMQTGEESRYVKQLRYLLGHDELEVKVLNNKITTPDDVYIEVKKTPEMLDMLSQRLGPEGFNSLSASSLKDFITCPLRFYLGFVQKLKEDQDVNEDVDQRTFGDILHNALCDLYSRCEGKTVDAGLLKQYIEHPEGEITRAIQDAFKMVMKTDRVDGYNLLVSKILIQYVVETLRHDMQQGPFTYLAGEKKQKFLYPIKGHQPVRIACVFDRLDTLLTDAQTLRVVDYKTGNSLKVSKQIIPSIEDLFTPESKGSSEAFQVMLYCLMLLHATPSQLKQLNLSQRPSKIAPHLYFVRDYNSTSRVSSALLHGSGQQKSEISDFLPFAESFDQELQKLISRIFDLNETFYQCADKRHCTFCVFKTYCQKT